MKKIIFILTLITFYVLLFNSCKKCEENNLGNVTFTATDLQIVPYNGTEKLTFYDSLGNSMIFSGGKRWSNNQDKCPDQFPNDPDCTGDYWCLEGNYTSFYGQGNNGNIEIYLSMVDGPYYQNVGKGFSISIYTSGTTYSYNYECDFGFDALKLYNYDTLASKLSFKDSLMIGPKKFYSVYVLKYVNNPDGLGNLQYVFYTINQGIVGLRTGKGKTWYLSNEQ